MSIEAKIPGYLESIMDNSTEVRLKATRTDSGWELKGKSRHTYHITDREFEILNLICKYGYNNENISKVLNIGQNTVRNYLHNLAAEIKPRKTEQERICEGYGASRMEIIVHLGEEGILSYVHKKRHKI